MYILTGLLISFLSRGTMSTVNDLPIDLKNIVNIIIIGVNEDTPERE